MGFDELGFGESGRHRWIR